MRVKLRASTSVIIAFAILVSAFGVSVRPHIAQAEIERLTNNTPIQINGTTTSAFPSTIVAPAMPGVLADVDVYLTGLNYPSVGDLQVLLVSPAGTRILVMAFAGGVGRNVTGASLRFNQSAPSVIREDGFSSGQFRPSVYDDDALPSPAPVGPYEQNLGALRGESAAGTWQLYVASTSDTVGRIDAWRLDLVTDTTEQTGDILIGLSSEPSPAAVYPSVQTVSDIARTGFFTEFFVSISVTIHDLAHEAPGDLDILLRGPGGQTAVLMSDAGGTTSVSGVDLTFSEAGMRRLPFAAAIGSGTYQPTNYSGSDAFPAPAPSGVNDASLSVFDHADPNGEWQLYIVDDTSGNGGSIASGWTLNVDSRNSELDLLSNMTIGGSSAPSAASTYPETLTIANAVGPITRVVVGFSGLSHSRSDDLDIRLSSPAGNAQLLSDAGGNTSRSGTTYIDSSASLSAPDSDPLVADAHYRPTNYSPRGDIDSFPAPIPIGTFPTSLGGMLGDDANGDWKLWIVDDTVGENGSMQGWQLYVDTRQSFHAAGEIRIINSLAAIPYPSSIVVAGTAGEVVKVEVTIENLDHTFPDDLDILLAGPDGQSVVLMSDAGGGGDLSNVDLTFRDDAASALSDSIQLVSGSYRPTNILGMNSDVFRAPAPADPTSGSLAAFNGTAPNGTWRLFVVDDRSGSETGDIEGWSLRIETNEPVTFTDMPDIRIAANSIVRVRLQANDPEAGGLSFTPLVTPPFPTTLLLSASEQIVRFEPTLDDIGTHEFALRVSDGRFTDEVSFDITVFEDSDPPTLTVTQTPLPNVNGWNNTDVVVDAVASDPEPSGGLLGFSSARSGELQMSNDRVAQNHMRFVSEGEGISSLKVRAIDNVGFRSAEDARIVRVDKTAPTSLRPRGRLIEDTQASQTTVPVQIEMKATDARSGVSRYDLRQRDDGGAFAVVPLTDPTQVRATRTLEMETRYAFRSRATDLAGNTGTLGGIYAMHTEVLNDTSPLMNFSYSAGWTVVSQANAIGGDEHVASVAGESMSVAWFGTSVAWIASEGPNRGIAEVYLDEVLVDTVDLYNPTGRLRMLAFTFNGNPNTNSDHILEIRVTGTKNAASSGTRIAVDAFVMIERD